MDEQKLLMQGVWRKAGMNPEGVKIPCKTHASAIKMRFALYNAVRGIRTGKETGDAALQDAVEGCSIGFLSEDNTVLHIRRKLASGMMDTLRDILGEDAGPGGAGLCLTPEEIEAQKSLEALQEKLQAPKALDVAKPREREANPYYTRGAKGEVQ